jgi:blue copper oxidase
MKQFLSLIILLCFYSTYSQTYNNLWIPDTLSGKTFKLTMKEGSMNWGGSVATQSAGINASSTHAFWGPTLFFNYGDTVHINVENNLADTTTVHWHGMHLPAMMDGGPHQPIAPGTTWDPFWKVMNNAATYWYHPHLHMMSLHQITLGLGGFIIVRDPVESALALPRTYGIDDFPLALSDRRFNSTTAQLEDASYGDSMMVNGVLRAQLNTPAQVVRFRVLNAGTERSYNIGFSDNRSFSVITSDGGLLNAPVSLTRYLLSAGERIEILVNFLGQSGQSIDLKAYNSTLPQNIPGGDVFPNGPLKNALARIDFNILHLNIIAATAQAVTAIPATLASVTPYPAASASRTRYLSISDSNIVGIPGATFLLNHRLYNEYTIDYNVPLNDIEIWQISNSGNFSHPFHIHDVEFNLLSRDGSAPPAAEQGWKDVVLVKAGETVRFIAKFADFSDEMHPYMFHCHIAKHEDDGMMGQFIVSSANGVQHKKSIDQCRVYPNPAHEYILLQYAGIKTVRIFDCEGKLIYLKTNEAQTNDQRINTEAFAPGIYFVGVNEALFQKIVVQH